MFFGCKEAPSSSEFIMLSLSNTAQGQTIQSLDFSVGSGKLKSNGASDLQVLTFRNKLISNVQKFREEFLLNFAIIYASKPDERFKIGDELIITSAVYREDTDSIGFNIIFNSQEGWQYYHPSQGSSEADFENGLIMKSSSTGVFPFSSTVKLSNSQTLTVGERYIGAYKNALEETGINIIYQPDLIYNYATASKKLKSDSDYAFTDTLYHHVWIQRFGQDKQSITIYVRDLNYGYWYILILTLPLCALAITAIVLKVKHKKQR